MNLEPSNMNDKESVRNNCCGLITAKRKNLCFQNEEKRKRATRLSIASKELAFQMKKKKTVQMN
jgi:hypothetical protein